MNIEEIIGNKYNMLTVLKFIPIEERENINRNILCECECGNLTQVNKHKLLSGHTKSCGCLIGKKVIERCRKYNKFDLNTYDYGVGYTAKDEVFYFDKEDFDKIKDYYWHTSGDYNYITTTKNNGKLQLKMHRVVMDCPDDLMVDHINHLTYDNRKENLRICDKRQNSWNMKTPTTNTSGYKGVSWNKRDSKWDAYIEIDGSKIRLGSFCDINDAIFARQNANESYQKEWSYENSISRNLHG